MTKDNNKTTLPRVRTLPKAIEEIRKLDSNTSFSLSALREMCRSGIVPTFRIGNKTLLNFDVLLDTLATSAQAV